MTSWTSDATEPSLTTADHSDVDITIEPAPPEVYFAYTPADEGSHAMPMSFVPNHEYLLPPSSTFTRHPRRSFNLPRPTSDGFSRTHSDTTGSRPRLERSYLLEGSAVDDDPFVDTFSYGSTPSSPAHSSYFSPSPTLSEHPSPCQVAQLPCSTFLAHAFTRHASTSSFSNSDTSGPSEFEWDGFALAPDFEDVGGTYERPMSSPTVRTPWGNGQLDVPAMYRERRGSFSGSETSSNAPRSPNPQRDYPSPSVGSDHDVWPNPSPQSSTTNSGHTEYPDNNQFEHLIGQIQLSDSKVAFAFSSGEASTSRLSHQGRQDISDAGRSLPQDILPNGPPGDQQPGFRPVVATLATRRAAKFRRKKDAPFVCRFCSADFTAKHNLKNHLNSHDSVKNFMCDKCFESFGTAHVLRRHVKKCKKRLQEGT
ncbi:hypothetical protein C8F04DRAFT_483801 [Mycena alexandri]|uniref:C2H2-type domain-containing protein n=1 Tax=Mycena alexandri TaxID=1745969 RepID=A0AAD6SYA9_9AGAR|nr:hypothetical protein C8F04DRAFT_483801 [Mycena alexandri]